MNNSSISASIFQDQFFQHETTYASTWWDREREIGEIKGNEKKIETYELGVSYDEGPISSTSIDLILYRRLEIETEELIDNET